MEIYVGVGVFWVCVLYNEVWENVSYSDFVFFFFEGLMMV